MSHAEARSTFGQPECAARLRSLLGPAGILRASPYVERLHWRGAPSAQLSDLLRVHEYEYLRKIEATCDALKRAEAADPLTTKTDMLDSDTIVTAHSYAAALRGAGAAIEAVRSLCAEPREARNAFCAIRPPGHHAGPRGAVGGQSAGFCLLSSAAIAAAYAMHVHRHVVKKVAIVDFDIHHGNGTEACVRNLIPSEWREAFQTAAGTLTRGNVLVNNGRIL